MYIQGLIDGGGWDVVGLVAGSGTSTGPNYSATVKHYPARGSVTNGNLTANYVAGVSFTGSTGTAAGGFNSTSANVVGYNYNTPANLNDLTGKWTGSGMFREYLEIVVESTGAYTGRDYALGSPLFSTGCPISGNVAPRPSGKNVFNTTYGGSCLVPNLSAQGIGIVSSLSNGKKQLILTMTNADKSFAWVAFLTK